MRESIKLNKLHTKFLGRNIIFLDTVDSTQSYAKSLKKEEALNGTIIVADTQTNGVGTHDRKWYTGRGDNLAMTLIIYPECDIAKLSNLTVLIAECIVQAIKLLYEQTLAIKAPNDIMYQNKKIAGILTESIVEGTIAKKVFIGIGLNIHQDKFPGTLENIATSLKKAFQIDGNREDIIATFLNIFEEEYVKLL